MSAETSFLIFALAILTVYATYIGVQWRRAKRERYIREFDLPPGLYKKLQDKRPEIDPKHHPLVARALRQFFLCHLRSGRRFVSMPSQVVDDLWHEFILYTRDYQQFCKKAFGGYMHHAPAVALGHRQTDDIGLRRSWRFACLEENINPKRPRRLPLLFAIDKKLGIANGFNYSPNCDKQRSAGNSNVHCGAHLGSGCGGSSDGGSWSTSDGGHSESGGASCGGGGCGGD